MLGRSVHCSSSAVPYVLRMIFEVGARRSKVLPIAIFAERDVVEDCVVIVHKHS